MRIGRSTVAGLLAVTFFLALGAQADPADLWWDEGWPYRVPVSASGSGVAAVAIDFSVVFASFLQAL